MGWEELTFDPNEAVTLPVPGLPAATPTVACPAESVVTPFDAVTEKVPLWLSVDALRPSAAPEQSGVKNVTTGVVGVPVTVSVIVTVIGSPPAGRPAESVAVIV
jgi:hypothetical protein